MIGRGLIGDAWKDALTVTPAETVPERWCDYDDCYEAFAGRHWEDLTHQQVMVYRQCVRFLSPKAVLYFLPAFMLASIHEVKDDSNGWDVTEYTILAIERILTEGEANMAVPNPAQRLAIGRYLDAILECCSTKESHEQVMSCMSKVKVAWGC